MSDKKNASSYLDTLSPGHESDTVKEYDPATTEGQIGKEHEEEVAKSNNWEGDKRDEVGKAASNKKIRLAKKLRRIARELEATEMKEEYQEAVDDAIDQAEDEATGKSPEEMQDEPEDLSKVEDKEEEKSGSKDEMLIIEATHPIEHDAADDDPEANMSAQTGDEEWIDIGPGEFDDKRDEVGKAS